MELGNMIFGNSRGEVPLPREDEWDAPWQQLCDALAIEWRGTPDEGCKLPTNAKGHIETDVFRIQPYDWDAECDCGASDAVEDWHEANKHGPACYQAELRQRMDQYKQQSGYAKMEAETFGSDKSLFGGMEENRKPIEVAGQTVGWTSLFTPREDSAMDEWRAASKRKDEFEKKLFDELCAKHGVSREYGAMVHCTCGRDQCAQEHWEKEIGGHTGSCRVIQPNFLYKPTGFRINWYKYPFRDSYMSPGISNVEFRKLIQHCIDSASKGGCAVEQESITLSAFEENTLAHGFHSSNPAHWDYYVCVAENDDERKAVSRLLDSSLVKLRSMQFTKAGATVYLIKITEKGYAAVKAVWEGRKT